MLRQADKARVILHMIKDLLRGPKPLTVRVTLDKASAEKIKQRAGKFW